MTQFTVPEMSCGHCTAAIEKSIRSKDGSASVECDLETHIVSVTSGLGAGDLEAAIRDAGFEVQAA